MKENFTNGNGLIQSGADTKAIAQDIVNNIESWRVDSQAKTNLAFDKVMSNMRKKDAERARIRAESVNLATENDRGYGLGHGRITGD
jgi:hypothetical protein